VGVAPGQRSPRRCCRDGPDRDTCGRGCAQDRMIRKEAPWQRIIPSNR
jgi:hypothetical protein